MPGLPMEALTVSMVETLRCIFICFFWFLYFWNSELFFKSMEADLWNFKLVEPLRSLSEFDAFLLIPILAPLSHFWYIDGVQTTSSTGKSSKSSRVFFLCFFFFRFFLSFLLFLSSSVSVDEDEDFKGFIRRPRGMESSEDSLSDFGSSFLGLKIIKLLIIILIVYIIIPGSWMKSDLNHRLVFMKKKHIPELCYLLRFRTTGVLLKVKS